MQASLISVQNNVQTPFIVVKIGDYTFGEYKRSGKLGTNSIQKVTFPNLVTAIDIKKVNGAINTYTVYLTYGITEHDDPNMIEKVISSVSETRKINFLYGDYSAPAFIYKNEEAIITKVTSKVNFKSSQIEYTISATSSSLSLNAGVFNFPGYSSKKPSDVLKKLILDEQYGLTTIFYGMKKTSQASLSEFIVGDDKPVKLQAQASMSIIAYINYLVSCMTWVHEPANNPLKSALYFWSAYDDITNEYGGPYFKVVRVDANARYTSSSNAYSIDVGYPGGTHIIDFSINTNDSWAILYNHSKKINLSEYSYEIDDSGKVVPALSPVVTKSSKYLTTTETSKAWWSQMTQYPVSATLTIKGLLKPAVLMSFIKINSYFFGKKHISSGLYIITKQQDRVDSSGYKTTLSLTRISGDEM